jgi:hypothetical protein
MRLLAMQGTKAGGGCDDSLARCLTPRHSSAFAKAVLNTDYPAAATEKSCILASDFQKRTGFNTQMTCMVGATQRPAIAHSAALASAR